MAGRARASKFDFQKEDERAERIEAARRLKTWKETNPDKIDMLAHVVELHDSLKLKIDEIVELTGVSRATLMRWLSGDVPMAIQVDGGKPPFRVRTVHAVGRPPKSRGRPSKRAIQRADARAERGARILIRGEIHAIGERGR